MKKILAILLAVLCVFSSISVFAADESAAAAEEEIFIEAGVEIINKYNAEIDAKIEEIKNSPTELEFTGTTYYVSSSTGDDSNDGLSPETAWKTLEKVNSASAKFEYGTNVLLKRGDTWRLRASLRVISGMTLSTYGEGAKPKIICSRDASSPNDWEATPYPNIYKYTGVAGGFSTNVGAIIFDGGRAWGILTSGFEGKYDPTTKGFRVDNGAVFNGLEHYQIPARTKFEGYQDLKGNLEFHHDMANQSLYLYCRDGNPGAVFGTIELSEMGSGIQLVASKETTMPNLKAPVKAACDIIVDNIHIYGAASHGIGAGSVKNVIVQHCIFEWIGGASQFDLGNNAFKKDNITRFGNAVESYGNSDNFTMYHNYATQVFDCCWTVQYMGLGAFNDIHIYENVAEFANTGSEVWIDDGGYVTNMQIHDNYDRYIGYGYSHHKPSKYTPIDKAGENWIGAGGFFYGGTNTGTKCEGNDVYNNVYMLSAGKAYSVASVHPQKYNFHDNVFVMEEGKNLGSVAPFDGKYTKDNIFLGLKRSGAEKGTKYYMVPANPLGNTYEFASENIERAVDDFTDIPENFWGRDAIEYSILKGLFKGTTATEFSPNGNVTRAQLVTVLSRMAGNIQKGNSTYTDVNNSAWYAEGVYWAEKNGIVAAGGKFRPDDKATREELADMLYKYARSIYKHGSIDGAPTFADSASVTPAYADGVKFCTKNGIIGGYDGNIIKPKGNATRAETATMIKRFLIYLSSAVTKATPEEVLANEADAIILSGNDLKKMLDNKLVRATVEADGSIKFVPFSVEGTAESAREIRFMHLYNPKLDLLSNPYAVVKYNAANTGDANVKLTLKVSTASGRAEPTEISSSVSSGKGMGVLDLSSYTNALDKYTYKNEIVLSIAPWSGTADALSYFILEEIIFFDNVGAAMAYAG